MTAVMSFEPPIDRQIAMLRVPPHSIEAESSVLGGLMLDNDAWDRVGDLLTDTDFYRAEHKLVFASIGALVNACKTADMLSVYDHLQGRGKADEVGGMPYLHQLAQYVPSAANIRRYAEMVRERSILRRLVGVSDEIATMAFSPMGRQVAEVLDECEQKLMAVGEAGSRLKQGFVSMEHLMAGVIDRVTELSESEEGVPGISTGFYDLDRMTSGMHPGDLIIIAARPSMGKTALAINIAEHVSIKLGLPSGIFSMEMEAGQLAQRCIGSIGRIDQTNLRTGRLNHDEWSRLPGAVDTLRGAELHIDETGGLTISELRANARRLKRQCGGKLGVLVVDYLQLMTISTTMKDENRATAIGDITRGLKLLAKELGCPVIALSQLNRAVESRTDKRPMMSDLRESGSIEQDADVIMFIYRDEYYTKHACREPGVAEVIISKQRSGPTGTVKLAFLNNFTRFESLAPGHMRGDLPMREAAPIRQYTDDV